MTVDRILACTLSVLFSLSMTTTALAQVGGTGSIQGTVTDPAGSVVPGATVTATAVVTGVQTTRKTSDSGAFMLPLLPAGEYKVTVESPGFKTLTQPHIILEALQFVSLNPKLEIGTADQVLVVTDQPTMLKTDDVALGSSIGSDVYNSLPLAMNNKSARDPSAFVGLSIGVNSYSTQAAGPSTGSFNGGQPNQNEGYVEGLPMTSAGTEGDTRNLAFGVSVEAIDQFQVQTSGSKAMYEGQGVSNYTIKSGTNKFHGGVYEYFRNTALDAKGYIPPVRPPEHQNEFGVSIGGPIFRDKIFFFGNYDGYRYSAATQPNFQSIPTAAERTGDFSAFQPIYDPLSTTCSNGVCTRTQFSYNGKLNVIPPDRISKVAQSFQSYLPTNFANSGILSNYLATLPDVVSNNNTTDKVDINLSEKNKLFGLYSYGKYSNPLTGSLSPLTTSALPVPYADGRGVIEYATLAQVKDTYALTSNLLNVATFGVSRLFIPLTSNTATGGYPAKAGLNGLPAGTASTGFPDITFAGSNAPINWGGANSHTFTEAQTTFTAQENVLWTKGKHNLTFGFQWQALQDNENFSEEAGFTFAVNETGGYKSASASLDPNTGHSYASFLLGAVDSSIVPQIALNETGGRYKTYAPYIQDDYKVTPKLTLNLGLRWDLWDTFHEVNDKMSFFNPNLPNPLAGNILGALQFAGNGPDSCHCHTPVKMYFGNVSPRIGVAYRLGEKSVIRASYNIFYAHAGGVGGRTNGRQGLSQLGFNAGGSFSQTTTGQPAYDWDNGYPGLPLAPPFINSSYGTGFVKADPNFPFAGPKTAQTVTYGDPELGGRAPYYEDWSLDYEYSFSPNMTLSVAYAGSAGHRLPGAGITNDFTNQIPTKYLGVANTPQAAASLLTTALNATTLAQVQAKFPSFHIPFPNFTGGTVAQALKPFPQYNSISDPWLNIGFSNYNALQVSFNRRFSAGLATMVNYTFSKEIDDLAGLRFPNRNDLERSVGAVDHAHVITSTVLYQLPFGPGRRWHSENALVNQIVGNWQLSGIYSFATGAPLSITSTGCNGAGIIDAVCYPNYADPATFTGVRINGTPGHSGEDVTKTQYLNPLAFTAPTVLTYGNTPRTAPYNLFAPHIADIDVSFRREFVIHEAVRFAFQADAFNVTNEVHFSAPVTNASAANFGSYTSQANPQRKLQLSARFTF